MNSVCVLGGRKDKECKKRGRENEWKKGIKMGWGEDQKRKGERGFEYGREESGKGEREESGKGEGEESGKGEGEESGKVEGEESAKDER